MLKKNGIALDVVSFGNTKDNSAALAGLLVAAGGVSAEASKGNIYEALLDPRCDCHLLEVSAGESIHDALMTSPVLLGSDGSAQVGEYGMDGDMDPELALVLTMPPFLFPD